MFLSMGGMADGALPVEGMSGRRRFPVGALPATVKSAYGTMGIVLSCEG
jgi:hypothetical protein